MSELVAKPSLSLDAEDCPHIRLAREADLPRLEWEGEYTHFRRLFAMAYQRAVQGRALLWLLEQEQRLIGQVFVLLKSHADRRIADGRRKAFIHSFRVRPELRNQGLGGQLMQHAECDLLERGFHRVTLNVARDNPDALRFYERIGYERVAREEGFWSYVDHLGRRQDVHEPSWRMRKRLLIGR